MHVGLIHFGQVAERVLYQSYSRFGPFTPNIFLPLYLNNQILYRKSEETEVLVFFLRFERYHFYNCAPLGTKRTLPPVQKGTLPPIS